MSGRTPDNVQVWNFENDFRDPAVDGPAIVALPQYFKEHGQVSTFTEWLLNSECRHPHEHLPLRSHPPPRLLFLVFPFRFLFFSLLPASLSFFLRKTRNCGCFVFGRVQVLHVGLRKALPSREAGAKRPNLFVEHPLCYSWWRCMPDVRRRASLELRMPLG